MWLLGFRNAKTKNAGGDEKREVMYVWGTLSTPLSTFAAFSTLSVICKYMSPPPFAIAENKIVGAEKYAKKTKKKKGNAKKKVKGWLGFGAEFCWHLNLYSQVFVNTFMSALQVGQIHQMPNIYFLNWVSKLETAKNANHNKSPVLFSTVLWFVFFFVQCITEYFGQWKCKQTIMLTFICLAIEVSKSEKSKCVSNVRKCEL